MPNGQSTHLTPLVYRAASPPRSYPTPSDTSYTSDMSNFQHIHVGVSKHSPLLP